MTTFSLLLRSVFYYWRTNLAVLLGVVAGTAVIGGAFVVGDSVRYSLEQMTLVRLGEIDHALASHRFFREKLAEEIADAAGFQERFDGIAPALVMPGSLTSAGTASAQTDGLPPETSRRSNRVNVYGLDDRAWRMLDHPNSVAPFSESQDHDTERRTTLAEPPRDNQIYLNHAVAEELGAKVGQNVTLWIELPSTIPRESLLGERDQSSVEVVLEVKAVLPEDSGAGRLALNPNQQMPANAFVSLEKLQQMLGLSERRERRTRTVIPGRVNTLFVSAKSDADARGSSAPQAADELSRLLQDTWTLEDLRLRLVTAERGYLSLESEQQILEDVYAEAGRRAAEALGLKQSPVMVYLANEFHNATRDIAEGENETGYAMYSIIAGIAFPDVAAFGPRPADPPFGPFEFVGGRPDDPLSEGAIASGGTGGIVLNEWLAHDLKANVGEEVLIKYHVVGSHGELPEEERRFRVHGVVRLDDTRAADPHLTPRVEGITDAETFAEWEQPFPMDLDRVTDRDEEYWGQYRATPKAFVTLETAQLLWGSRYGQLTSLRLAPPPDASLDAAAEDFEKSLLAALQPRAVAMHFQPVKYQGLQAAAGTTDFSVLFISFSFFLILSATILIGLLFRLGIERRSTQVGLLSAAGFTPGGTRRLFLSEGLLVVVVGGLIGVAAAVGYAALMIYGLKNWWYGAIQTRFLFLHATAESLALGFVISVAVAALAVWWGLRQLRGLSTRELLTGATERSLTAEAQRSRSRRGFRTGAISGSVAGILIAAALTGLIPQGEAFMGLPWEAVAFFIVGITLLVASLAFLAAWLDSDRSAAVRGAGLVGMSRLGLRNASRHRQRSVLTTALIASATFVIVAVAAGHRNPAQEQPQKNSGNGGFTFVAESATPVLQNMNTLQGRRELGLPTATNPEADASGSPSSVAPGLLDQMQVVPFRVRPGDDASCLNIYQVRLPTILGATQAMIERGGFRFVGQQRENPWTWLNEELPEQNVALPDGTQKTVPVYPVLGDMTTLQWSLKKSKGDTIAVPNDRDPDYLLKIAAVLDGSVFQRELVMSEENFTKLYAQQVGYRYFLIEVPADWTDRQKRDLATILETELTDYGFDVEPVVDRLARFLAVQNTYLSTFQTLGGLGLLLGTLGLATVMLRNVLERRNELALLRAVGFRNRSLGWLVLAENAFLLLWGLAAGSFSALLAMTPHLASVGADVPWTFVEGMLLAVLVVGMLAALLAVREAVRTPLLATLRSE